MVDLVAISPRCPLLARPLRGFDPGEMKRRNKKKAFVPEPLLSAETLCVKQQSRGRTNLSESEKSRMLMLGFSTAVALSALHTRSGSFILHYLLHAAAPEAFKSVGGKKSF